MSAKTGQLHGRDHGPDGADPIPGFSGDESLHWGTNTDTNSDGLVLDGDGSFNWSDGAGASIVTLHDGSITVTGDAETVFQGPDVQITGLGTGCLVTLQAGSLHTFKLDEATKITTTQLPTGGVVRTNNHSGTAILLTDEASGVTTGTFDGGSP